MSVNTASSFVHEKLNGIENFSSWKFLMKMILIHEELWSCIEGDKPETKEQAKLSQKALAKICLYVNSNVFPYIRNSREAWENLSRAYEDRGRRRLGLFRSLFSTKLSDRKSMEDYLGRISELSQQLQDIGSLLDDEFIAVIMLSGLPSSYDPMIMALENSNMKLGSGLVKGKLLQEFDRRDKQEDAITV